MTEKNNEQIAPVLEPTFPVIIRLHGFPVAHMHADGRVTGSIEALEKILADMRGPPNDLAFRLWVVLHALKNQRLVGPIN